MPNSVAAPRILIAACASGSGKTTIACGLMRAFAKRGLTVQACKCGPDYIDPMFHKKVLGTPSRNLDLFFADENLVRGLVAEGARSADLTLIEGVMGYYDGIAQSSTASAFHVASATSSPTILVVNARGRALSTAAEIAGFLQFRTPSQVAGVIVNRVTASYFPFLKDMIETECGIPVLGYVPHLENASLESRHLGLVSAGEVADLQERIEAVATTLEETLDLDTLFAIAQGAPPLHVETRALPEACKGEPVIALAYDDAFNFYYDDTLALMEQLGARLVRFSPLRDVSLPEGTCGLYIGGGYPELNAEALSSNTALLKHIRSAIESGMPTIAECGGFMYLHVEMQDAQGKAWPMVGAIAGMSFKTDKLGRFGYINLEAAEDNMLCDAGQSLPAHEFHYWDSENPGKSFHARKPQSTRSWDCVIASKTLYAGYPHLYLYSQPQALWRFLEACTHYAAQQKG